MFESAAGVVFDLDGTLVRLEVPWADLERIIGENLADEGIETADRSVWDLLDIASQRDLLRTIEPTINSYEIDGAEQSTRLPLADLVGHVDVPVAICSLNCEAACRRALAVHDLADQVDAVIGRDTVRPWKPDPAPLEEAIRRLEIEAPEGIFIGDSERDARTAAAAGVRFRAASDVLEKFSKG